MAKITGQEIKDRVRAVTVRKLGEGEVYETEWLEVKSLHLLRPLYFTDSDGVRYEITDGWIKCNGNIKDFPFEVVKGTE